MLAADTSDRGPAFTAGATAWRAFGGPTGEDPPHPASIATNRTHRKATSHCRWAVSIVRSYTQHLLADRAELVVGRSASPGTARAPSGAGGGAPIRVARVS